MSEPDWSMIDLDDREWWDATVERVPHSFSHTWAHCRAHSAKKERVVLFHAEWSDGEVVCPLCLREGPFGIDIATPFGFAGFSGRGRLSAFPEWWKDFASSQGWITGYLTINPWLSGPQWGPADGRHVHNSLFSLNLTLGEHVLYKRLWRIRRRQIRNWQTEEHALVRDRAALLAFVLEHADAFHDRVEAGPNYRLDNEAWRTLFASSRTLILGASYLDSIVNVVIFGLGKPIADAMFQISLPQGRDAGTFLVWNGMRMLMEAGIEMLNLGGGLSPTDSHAEAKRRFGGDEVEFPALRQVYDRTRYDVACRAAGCDPSTTAAYFPPYRANQATV